MLRRKRRIDMLAMMRRPRSIRSWFAIGCAGSIVIVVLFFVTLIAGLKYAKERRFDQVEAHLRHNQADLADAVMELIAANPDQRGVPFRDLPPALAAPGVRFAGLGKSHITLVVNQNPDVSAGFRLWVDVPAEGYGEAPTSIPNVFRYSHHYDDPESPTNRP